MIEYRKFSIETLTQLLGTAPANEELYREYIQSKAPDPEDADDELTTVPHQHEIDPEQSFQKQITGFHRHPDNNGLYMYDYQIMGFLKSAANTLKDNLPMAPDAGGKVRRGIKNARSKVNQFVTVFPRRILIADGPDGILQRPLRAQTAQGPRVSLAASEYLEPPIEFDIYIGLIDNKEIGWNTLKTIFSYGEVKIGLLQNRNSGYGKFRTIDKGVIDPEVEELPVL